MSLGKLITSVTNMFPTSCSIPSFDSSFLLAAISTRQRSLRWSMRPYAQTAWRWSSHIPASGPERRTEVVGSCFLLGVPVGEPRSPRSYRERPGEERGRVDIQRPGEGLWAPTSCEHYQFAPPFWGRGFCTR